LPVRLTVNELRINRVALAKDGARYEAGPVIASARAEPQLWSAQVKSLQSALGTAAAELQVATSRPFALKGALSLTQKEPAYNAQARISGTLERINIQADASAKDATATAGAILTLFATGPIEHLEIDARNVDPQYFLPALPNASWTAQLHADRPGGRQHGAVVS
jgi:translocation and assembly module TamB